MASPLEILAPDETRIPSVMQKIWAPFIGSTFGFGTVCLMNAVARRPLFSGIQRHAAFAAIGVVACSYVENKRLEYYADRDAVLRHYIELHPEDFPAPERKKYADILDSWVPIR